MENIWTVIYFRLQQGGPDINLLFHVKARWYLEDEYLGRWFAAPIEVAGKIVAIQLMLVRSEGAYWCVELIEPGPVYMCVETFVCRW